MGRGGLFTVNSPHSTDNSLLYGQLVSPVRHYRFGLFGRELNVWTETIQTHSEKRASSQVYSYILYTCEFFPDGLRADARARAARPLIPYTWATSGAATMPYSDGNARTAARNKCLLTQLRI